MKDDNALLFTSDIWLAAFLKAKGAKLNKIEGESRKAVFIFEDHENAQGLIKQFYNDSQIGILAIKNSMSDIKSALFNMV
ncbi:MAG: DUF5659 domain-containing protein [Candidatus Omnitrophica bacterium]|nr:DUF5659 domain-containing protein [Candidatus Omnitrophota bacterium]